MTMCLSKMKTRKEYSKVAHLVPGVVLMRSEGRTMDEIGKALNISRQRVHQIVRSAKQMETILSLWGFPFTIRTSRVLEDLGVKNKEEALSLYHSGHLYPGAIWSFGRKSYTEICEWLEVTPLKKRPVRGKTCPHCGKII